jgi:predicted NBD/HSP70 family sugar kinase
LGDVPIVVANDGDVTALAGSMSLGDGAVMGLAMGTSEAVGYVNQDGYIVGWFNELAFAPVDLAEDAMTDEWSGDIGVGCKYFSQDAVIKLAPRAGIELDAALTPAEKLKAVQTLLSEGSEPAKEIFRTIGCYLAHTLVLYSSLYDLHHLLVLGRVASGMGGELIVSECRRVLEEEYPDLNRRITVTLPDEKFRRVGQSMAAASLPEV